MAWAKGITQVVLTDALPVNRPAATVPSTGVTYVNRTVWQSLPKELRFFLLLHEWAHLIGQTRDEATADRIAFEEYAKRGYSLKASVKAMCRLLDFSTAEHYQRAWDQFQRALDWDRRH